jgi:hypothetical protein
MDQQDEERRLRRAAVARFGPAPKADEPADESQPPEPESTDKPDEDDNAASRRLEQQALWVDLQVRRAMERGDFDDLPGKGKPLDLPQTHDPDWWVKRLIEREKLSGIAPPAIALRREDAELEATIDREATEAGVRRLVEDFNRRVVEARRQLTGGPPVVTKLRDVDAEVATWRERRRARFQRPRAQQPAQPPRTERTERTKGPKRRWFRR